MHFSYLILLPRTRNFTGTKGERAMLVKVEINPQRLADVFTTAFESGNCGSLYWLPIVRNKKTGWHAPQNVEDEHTNSYPYYCYGHYWTHPGETFFYELSDESTGTLKLYKLTYKEISKRIKAMIKRRPDLLVYLVGDENSDDIADGPQADVIVQYIVLGDEIYG
jgi:hypothetical protein